MNARYKKFKLTCVIRSYTYVAHVLPKSGKLVKITAGCRTWYSFHEANVHYTGAGAASSWRFEDYQFADTRNFNAIAWRREAKAILNKLQVQVDGYRSTRLFLRNRRAAATRKRTRSKQ